MPRADARRNRKRLLEVAEQAFAAEGLGVTIQSIARRAAVSTGTVSRHFPTKSALVEAVLLSVLERLTDQARALQDAADPGAAFFDYFTSLVTAGTANRALFDTLTDAAPGSDLKSAVATAGSELTAALGTLLVRAQQAGAARPDIEPGQLPAVLVGALAMQAHAADSGAAVPSPCLTAVACDGLRSTCSPRLSP